MNGRGMVWFCEGYSPLNRFDHDAKELGKRSLAYPEWKGDSVVLGRMFFPKHLLIREPEWPGYKEESYPEWKGYGVVVLGRMFYPKPLLIREPEWPGYKEESYPEWKRDGVVLGRMFFPEPDLIRALKCWIQVVYPTLNGRGIVCYLEGCSALNLSWSGWKRAGYKEYFLPWMEGGWCCSWKDVLSWTSPHQGTRVTWLQGEILPWTERGFCGSWKDVLPWAWPDQDTKELDTRSTYILPWMEEGWCGFWKDVLPWTSPYQGTRVTWLQGEILPWMEEGWCGSWKDVLPWTSPYQGARVTWLQEGCSALNLSWSGC
jgi:hypothetical protein